MGCSAFLTNIMANQSKIPEKVNSHDMLDHFFKLMIKQMIPIKEKMKNNRKGTEESSTGKNEQCCRIKKRVELNWPDGFLSITP